jgi:hypothetical protein
MTTDDNETTAAEPAAAEKTEAECELEMAELARSGLEASAGGVGRPFSVWEDPADYARALADATARRDAAQAEVDAERAR